MGRRQPFFDSYSGWSFSQSGRERAYKLDLTTTKDLTVTDTNPNLDLHIVRFSTCSGVTSTTTALKNGADSVTLDNAAPGSYWIVFDGRNGAVGTTNLNIRVTGP